MKNNVLKQYIREILNEEIVTLIRGSEQYTYDISFDEKGNILKSKQINLSPDEVEILKTVEKTAKSVPGGEILKKLRMLKKEGIPLQSEIGKGEVEVAIEIMNNYWLDTLSWPTPSRVGRGELQLKLQFASAKEKEPDFVSTKGLKLSVKYLGNGSETAKTGEANKKIPEITNKLKKVLKLKELPQSSFSGYDLIEALSKFKITARPAIVEEVKKIINEIKLAIVSEHDVDALMMVDTVNGFYAVDKTNYQSMNPVSIRNSGTRVEFYGPNVSEARMTLEKALDSAFESEE